MATSVRRRAPVFPGDKDSAFHRHLVYDHVIAPNDALPREQFEAFAHTVRDLLAERWLATQQAYDRQNPKYVYYLSMEFLIGRSLINNVLNLLLEPLVTDAAKREGVDWMAIAEIEPDAGLGNGGLGRLAACFIDSLATIGVPAIGYGLRYQYGMFKQRIDNGYQAEMPDHWLRREDPWEVVRPNEVVEARLSCKLEIEGGRFRAIRNYPSRLVGMPYDRPVVGYGGRTVNTLRLWEVNAPDAFDYRLFNQGDVVGAVQSQIAAAAMTRVLYPDDSTLHGRGLRFTQEYLLVAFSLADIIARFRRSNSEWDALPHKVAIQLNDTHPSLAVAELMRILLDRAGLSWEKSWDLTRRTLAYTNHTLLAEALEKWPVVFFERMLPRHLEIIYEINRRFLDEVREQFPGDHARLQRMSLIEEGAAKQVRMAHVAIAGSHSVNGVARIHSDLLKTTLLKDFYEMYPERFNNKTNGVTPRRWLLLANPPLARLFNETIGEGWVADLLQLKRLLPFADDGAFRDRFINAKREAKEDFASWLRKWTGQIVDPSTIFDTQIKRIHEYKRQLLNVLHIIDLYARLKENPNIDITPRTFFFAGKAAPAYHLAKIIIKLINNVASVVNSDPDVRGRVRVVFLPDYGVSLAEQLIPASDISEQISTAGYEASGTGNMKFMMNGALTVGTRDGATVEIAEEVGEENIFLFGLSAEQVAASRGWYSPRWHYENEPRVRRVIDMIGSNVFSPREPGIFNLILEVLLDRGDFYMHLADFASYCDAQDRAGRLYREPRIWSKKSIINVACSGKFSSDRTIQEYLEDIWHATPVLPE